MPCHNRDRKQHNKHLINRGNLNFWINKKALKFWMAKKRKKAGAPFTYSDEAIKVMLIVFLSKLMNITRIFSYTQVCRRMQSIKLSEEPVDRKSVTDLVLDRARWCAKRHEGKSKWIKLHVGIDQKSGKLTLAEATGESSHDTSCLEKALKTCNKRKGEWLFTGIADSKKYYEACVGHNKKLLTPSNGRTIPRHEPEYGLRCEALKVIKGLRGDEIARSI